uniref:WAT1-related protein At4g08300-like n=1 Tax=Cicer arietinum TaxID=3827 RepID=A0A1S3E1U4_CICAR|nr:WAT1-related protein At4g08300-like [Cicer arietinum]
MIIVTEFATTPTNRKLVAVNRLEVVDVKNPRGLAKIFGTVLSLIGALIMILYKGHTIQSLKSSSFHIGGKMAHSNWIKGSILTVVSCILWSLWFILQLDIVTAWNQFPILSNILFWGNNFSGSILGVLIVIMGLYLLLWGKESDRDYKSQRSFPAHTEEKECKTQIKTSV